MHVHPRPALAADEPWTHAADDGSHTFTKAEWLCDARATEGHYLFEAGDSPNRQAESLEGLWRANVADGSLIPARFHALRPASAPRATLLLSTTI